jgi:hypothetical protein
MAALKSSWRVPSKEIATFSGTFQMRTALVILLNQKDTS